MTTKLTYLKTHPWITFSLNLRDASPELWMLLGEAASKCDHIAGVPLQPDTSDRLLKLYLAKGALATNAIEGNTLTEQDALDRIDGSLKLPESEEYLGQEIDNIVNACNAITHELEHGKEVALTVERINGFNGQILNGLPLRQGVIPGEIRKLSVAIPGVYVGPSPDECEMLLGQMCEWLNNSDTFKAPADKTHQHRVYAIIKSIVAHIYIAWIHPYGDGNGRTARLVEFLILLLASVPQPACHLLSNHYNLTRTRYYKELDYASKSGGDILPFIEYAAHGLVDGLLQQLEEIRRQQWALSWQDYVHESFAGNTQKSARRQEHLVIALTEAKSPVPANKIKELTPRLAAEYANKTSRTLSRDINSILKKHPGLIKVTPDGVCATPETIIAFLPWRKPGNQGAPEKI